MSFDMSKVRMITMPDGYPSELHIDGSRMWARNEYLYVSLGDSIAAGHAIDSDWEEDYGEGSQYQDPTDDPTRIVEGCYTDLLYKEIVKTYGEHGCSVRSFARSGDTVMGLMNKLGAISGSRHTKVADAVKRASLVTVCIGANDVLQPAMSNLENYINTGDLEPIRSAVRENMDRLWNRENPYSYRKLLEALVSINPKATYVFTTIYNPYKYIHLDESTAANSYTDGFLGNIMAGVPNLEVPLLGLSVRGYLYNDMGLKTRIERINAMSGVAEEIVSELNSLIQKEINDFLDENEMEGTIKIAPTKDVFDPVPDRLVGDDIHYNDLVNVEFTRGFKADAMDWGSIWNDFTLEDVGRFQAIMDNAFVAVWNYVFDKVIYPDMDVHPEREGQRALMRSFAYAVWPMEYEIPKRTIYYEAGEGSGTMEPQHVLSLYPNSTYATIRSNAFSAPTATAGWRFVRWNGTGGIYYKEGTQIQLLSDIQLVAEWSNQYPVRIWADKNLFGYTGSTETGPREYYGVYIDDKKYNLDRIGDWATYNVPYGKEIGIVACTENKNLAGKCSVTTADGQIYYGGDNGTSLPDAKLRYGVLLGGKVYATTGIEVRFIWRYDASDVANLYPSGSWWTATQTTFDP